MNLFTSPEIPLIAFFFSKQYFINFKTYLKLKRFNIFCPKNWRTIFKCVLKFIFWPLMHQNACERILKISHYNIYIYIYTYIWTTWEWTARTYRGCDGWDSIHFCSFFFLRVGGWVGAGQTGTHNGSNRPESWGLKSQAGLFFPWLFRTGSSNNNRGSSFKRDSVTTFTTWLSWIPTFSDFCRRLPPLSLWCSFPVRKKSSKLPSEGKAEKPPSMQTAGMMLQLLQMLLYSSVESI